MKLLYSFLKDLKLSSRGMYFYMEFAFAFIFVAVMLFVVPEESNTKRNVFVSIQMEGIAKEMSQRALSARDDMDITFFETRKEVEDKMASNRTGVGLILSMDNGKIKYDYILQGYENQKFRNIMEASIQAGFASKMPGYKDNTIVTTLGGQESELPRRIFILPIFLALNAAMMGLFIIASYIFFDKDEGTIKAFAVSPASMWHYLLGKMGVMLAAGLMSGLIAVIFIARLNVNYLHLLALLISANLFGTTMGLLLTSFFNTMMKAMGWLYVLVVILAVAVISYTMPAFSPWYIKILPSYPLVYAFKEVFLKNPDVGFIYLNVLGFFVASIVLFLISNYRFKRTFSI